MKKVENCLRRNCGDGSALKNEGKNFFYLLADKRGEGYIKNCILIIVELLLLSTVLFYAESLSVAEEVRRGIKEAMDGALRCQSVGEFASLDDGSGLSDADVNLNFRRLFENYFEGMSRDGEGKYSLYDDDGGLLWSVTYPTLVNAGGVLKASFTVSFPVRFAGLRLDDMDIPMTVQRKNEAKY